MSKEKKDLSKLLETYQNTAEDFYQQMKNYYKTGIVASVKLPFSPEEVKKDPLQAVEYILDYKVNTYNQPKSLNDIVSILFELGPILFAGDKVEVLILDQKVNITVPAVQLNLTDDGYSYTISIKLKESGAIRTEFESSINRDLLASHLKDRLKQGIYLALRSVLFEGFSDNPQADLEMSNIIAQPMGVVIKEPKDVEKVLDSPHSSDLGLRDLEQLYVLHDLLQDENWWVFHDVETLEQELKQIIYKSRQMRIDGPIVDE